MNHKAVKYVFFCKVFIILIAVNFLLNDVDFLLSYSALRSETVISKSSSVLLFLASLLFTLWIGKVKWFSQSYALIFFTILAFGVGGFSNGISTGTFSHIYSFIMPITISSVGYYFAHHYEKNEALRKHTMNCIRALVIIEFGLTLLYLFLKSRGAFFGNSFGAGGLIFGTLFFLANRRYKLSLFSVIGVIMSGKRSSLVIIGVGVLVYLWQISRGKISKKATNMVIILVLIFMAGVVYNYTNYLDRFVVFSKMDISALDSIHIATSYRTLEMEYVIRFLLDSPLNFLFGAGFGSEIFNGFRNVRYIHFSPLNFAFISGVPFAILMYVLFIIDTFEGLKSSNNIMQWAAIAWVSYFVLTFTAATVSTHSITWFVLGALKYSNRLSKSMCENSISNRQR